MHYAAESLDMGITHQIGVLLQSALLYFCVIKLHDGVTGTFTSAMTQQCCWEGVSLHLSRFSFQFASPD